MILKYKHLILFIFLSLSTTMLWAQSPKTSWILNTDESAATKNYLARESIALQNNGTTGFHFKADVGKTFSAKIDAGLLFPPNDKTYAVKASDGSISYNSTNGAVVGSIPGSASVSPTGAANYQIPIDVPLGINGMQPQVSIGYNSQGGFGALGIGWDISGISSISRTTQNLYFDAQNGKIEANSIQFNDVTDRLLFDGQRLILISGTNFQEGAVYGTEVENYAQVKILTSTESGEIYFVVTTKEGKVMEYGNTTNSLLKNANNTSDTRVLGWKLNKVTDTYGNYMTFTYSDFGQYLQRIDYAGQSVEFGYNHILDTPKKSYISDFLVTQPKLLSTITTKSGTTTLKTFGFGYTTDNRLTTINETAPDNSKVNATTINWGADNNVIQQVNVGSNPDKFLGKNGGSVYTADVNGDGYPDRIELWPGVNCDNDGNKGHVFVRLFNSSTKQFNTNIEGGYYFCPNDNLDPKLTIGDINNDGKDEIILFKKNWLVVLGLSNNTLSEIHPGINFDLEDIHQGYNKKRKYEIITANVNNDKYLDVIMVFGYHAGFLGLGSERAGYTVFTGGEAGLTKVYDVSYNDDNAFEDFKIGDFNADGKIDVEGKVSYDIYGFWDQSKSYDTNYIDFHTNFNSFSVGHFSDPTGNKYTLDYDGDGLPETLTQNLDNQGNNSFKWYFEHKSSNLYLVANPANSQIHPEETYQMYPIDYNGDGLVDLIQGDEITLNDNSIVTNWHFYKNIGNLNYQWENTIQTNSRLNNRTVFISDINGDGIADLVYPTSTEHCSTETICPPGVDPNLNLKSMSTNQLQPIDPGCTTTTTCYTSYEYMAFTIPNANRRNIVTGITNGMGQSNSFAYKSFSAYDQTPTTGVVRNLKAPIPVVDTQTEPDESVTSYTFEKPRIHTEGKGFLGFSTVTAVNTDKNAKIVSNYGYESSYYSTFMLNQTVTTADGNTPISTSAQTNSLIIIDAARKRFIPTITEQVATDQFKGVEQKTVTDFTDYLEYPTKLTQTTTFKDLTNNTEDLKSKVVTTLTGPGGVTPYLPFSVETTRTQGGQSDTRSTSYSYEYNPNPNKKYQIIKSTEITNPDKEAYKVITETSNPDAFGHMRNVAIKAKNQTGAEITRGSSVSYTESGRFIASKTNNLDETTNFDWGIETYAQLKSETTTIGGKSLITSYTYNGRGDLTETRYPDGNRKTAVLQWAGTGGVSGAVYYTYSETSGSAPVKVWYDALGREIQKEAYGLDATKKIIVNTEYYTTGVNKGKVHRVSEPHFEGDTYNWAATYGYNATYGYAEDVTTPVGITHTTPNKLTTSVTTPEGTSATVTNAAGQTLSSTVNGKKVSYEYYTNGLTKSSLPEGGQAITMKYNPQGKRTLLVDPDGGTIRTEYNGWGELTKEVQLIHLNKDSIITLNNYDSFGRLLSINRNNEMTTYTYDSGKKSRVNEIEITGKNKQTFGFDDLDRVTSVTETITANGTTKTFVTGKKYDALGRIKKEIYPSEYYTVNTYDQYSNLTEVRDEVGSGHSIWKANTENALGQATSIFKGLKETTFGYDPINHQATSIYADGVVNYTYGYDSKNNLSWRKDILTTQQEDFGYDELNRLTSWKVTRAGIQKPYGITYDPTNLANIKTKSGIETDPDHLLTMYYGGKNPNGSTTGRLDGSLIGPHALSTISGVPISPFPQTDLTVTYTDFKKIFTLHEGTKDYELTYGVDDQRRKSVYYANGKSQGATLTRYYVGNYEEEIYPDGKIRKIHYLSGAILIQHDGAADSLLYTFSDAQGSLIALTDVNGGIVRKYAYDPWGSRRKYDNWNEKDDCLGLIINRGYTGHEHLDAFGVINMNGRVYDPSTAMFFSPDPYVQAPGEWLNYNRYGYCYGNPFRYTDPSGEWFGLDDLFVAGAGFVFGYVSYGITTGNWGWKAAGAGGMSALFAWVGYNTCGIATAGQGVVNTATSNYVGSMAINTVASQIMPPMNVPIGNNFYINVSPSLGIGPAGLTGGISFSANYHDERLNISAGLSLADNYLGFGVGATYDRIGGGYSLSRYGSNVGPDGKPNSQWVGGARLNIGDFSFRIENDALMPAGLREQGQPQDRWRTNALEISYGNFSIGSTIYTNDPKNTSPEVIYDSENIHYKADGTKLGTWKNGQVYSSPVWFGYRNGNSVYRVGYSFKEAQDIQQNEFTHRNGFLGGGFGLIRFGTQNFYRNYDNFKSGFYMYSGNYQPYSLFGY